MITTITRGEPDQAAAPNASDTLIVEEMRERYNLSQELDQEFLNNSDEELEFAAGEHWLDKEQQSDVRRELQSRGRSAMTIDLLNPSIELVVNPMRINKPTARFMPVGEDADDATADIRQGLYRNIDRESRAAVARETAHDFAVRVGRGYYQILIEDEPGLNFDQRISIKRIDDLGVVMIDQSGIEADYSDAEWAGIWDDIPVREFRAQYGKDADTSGQTIPEPERAIWFKGTSVRRLVYYRRLWFQKKVAKLQDGIFDPATGKPIKFLELEAARASGHVVAAVKTKWDYRIQRFECSGSEVLNRTDWPGRWIPIVVMVGREVFRGRRKKKIHSGMIRPAMDVTRVHNFAESRLVDEVALSPLPHMMAAVGQLDTTQQAIVNSINKHPWAVVTWTPKNAPDGSALPMPQWVSPSPNLAAVVQAAQHAKDNLQRVLNTYSPQLGQMQGDQSGKAIREVKDQGDISHAAFPDNAKRALLHEARIINDLMDYVYSDERAITITQPDDTTKRVLINKRFRDEKTGEEKHYLFGTGKYDVAIDQEHAYPTRLAEASDKLLDLAHELPVIGEKAPDLLVQAIGLPGTIGEKLRDRLRPPGVDDDNPLPPIAQQKIAQLQQALQMLTEALNASNDLINQKRLELGSAERQNLVRAYTTLLAVDLKLGSQEAQLEYKNAVSMLQAQLAMLVGSPETGNPNPNPQTPQATPAPGPGAPPAGAGAPLQPPAGAAPAPGMPQ